jgi:hypothetical protein
MSWSRRGLIYAPAGRLGRDWAHSHAQCPTPTRVSSATLRIYFGTRDTANRTRPTFIDVDPARPERILYEHDRPVLDLGELGCFDDAGVMPSCLVDVAGEKFLYYVGWNTSTTVPYRTSIGVAVSGDGGLTFRRLFAGPIMDRTPREPHFCSTPFVIREGSGWRMWYLSCTGWRRVGDRAEPQYEIKTARSDDGIDWRRVGDVAIAAAGPEEALARPWVLRGGDGWRMWFCHRSLNGYRTDPQQSYRIGCAESTDGLVWRRQPDRLETAAGDWDSEMTAYPAAYEHDGRVHLVYNGNGFGRSGFGYAVQQELENGADAEKKHAGDLRRAARVR